jgi:hypothetical protein
MFQKRAKVPIIRRKTSGTCTNPKTTLLTHLCLNWQSTNIAEPNDLDGIGMN